MTRAPKLSSELVLVASERHREYEAARGARVLTLREFATRLADAHGDRLEISLEGMRLLTQRILGTPRSALAVPVDEALGQLRRAGTEVADLSRIGGARASLLSDILRQSELRLEQLGLRDARSSSSFARAALESTELRELEGVTHVRVRGVSQWENGDLALLEALHRKLFQSAAGSVSIELPTVPESFGAALRSAVSELATRLEQRWADEAEHPELEFVEARTEALPPIVIQAAHEASEARAVARGVLEGLACGLALDRIAIVPVDAAEAFLEPLRAELSLAKLPFSEAWSQPASTAPEAHAALELLRLAQGPLLRDSLVDLLCVPDLEIRALLGVIPFVHFVHVIAALPVRVDRTGQELLGALDAQRRREGAKRDPDLSALDAARQVLSALITRFERFRLPSTRRVFRDRARELFAELGLLTASPYALAQALRYAERADHAPLSALGQNARAGRAIDLALDRVVSAAEKLELADEILELSAFFEEFAGALAGVQASLGAGRAGTLRIARPAEVAGLDWDLLIVCRAASSTLDWQASASDGVLDANLVEQLPRARRPLTAGDRALFTRLALASALSRSARSVVTWAKRDARGASGASRLVMNLEPEHTRVEPASPLDPQARRVLAMPRASPEVRMRAELELRRQAFYADPGAAPDRWNGCAGPLSRWVGGDADRPLALTQLERFARCGFLGFSGAVLRVVRDDSVADGLSARERGTLIHEALAIALNGTRASFGSRDWGELEREALERAERFLFGHASTKLRGAALRAALEDVAALLRWSFANSDGIWFSEAERAFGKGEEWAALPVGSHYVSGRIDRIDSNSDGSSVRVIDYKTGVVRLTGDHGAQLFQPWLYAQKVAQEYAAKRVSSGYLSLKRRKPEWKAAVEESKPDSEAIQEKLLRAERLIADLHRGAVAARPVLASSCTRCDARDICRRPLSAPHEANE